MIILGLILAVLGYFVFHLSWVLWVGVALVLVGLVLLFAGSANHPVGGRRYWY